ncbi:MAG: hypothetical protein SFU98_11760 [Leptospiraceae bacterium]|nr:hypothetical protein [Leptospiraceae bacterium]
MRLITFLLLLLIANCNWGSERDVCEASITNNGSFSGDKIDGCLIIFGIIDRLQKDKLAEIDPQKIASKNNSINLYNALFVSCIISYNRLKACEKKSEYIPAFFD